MFASKNAGKKKSGRMFHSSHLLDWKKGQMSPCSPIELGQGKGMEQRSDGGEKLQGRVPCP